MADEIKNINNITKILNDSLHEIPQIIPIMSLDNFVVYPFMITPIIVIDEKNKKLIDEVLLGDKIIGLFSKSATEEATSGFDIINNIGTACIILRMLKIPDGTIRLLVHGLSRIKILERISETPYLKAKIEICKDEDIKDKEVLALIKNCHSILKEIVSLSSLPEDLLIASTNINEPGKLADLIASNLSLRINEQQELLEILNVKARLSKVYEILTRELEVLRIGSKIQTDVKTRLDKSQREYYLREQLKSIKKELGEEDTFTKELEELKESISKKTLPENVRETADKELHRLEMMQPASPEYTVSRTYLDWILSLPWLESSDENIDIKKAQKILDEDHYNLEQIKERILEYLSVIKLKKAIKGPILCFVGAPGVGKTSLGKSIARALGRKFSRMSLGGMRDEAEIRGHRRTYIGALPGRIIKALRDCAANNPVIMLDEVDKLGVDFRGDPASALLEVLDPEQNNSFVDHYLDLPFDLSKAMFITTANMLDPIPPPLRDRMEVLNLSGYTTKEKVIIAKKYLIPRQLEETGLSSKNIQFKTSALEKIIESYTREAGLRNLEREIGNICRKVSRKIAEGDDKQVHISSKSVQKFLGKPKFYLDIAQRIGNAGVAIGLAWTQFGGEILFIETRKTKGDGKLLLTGQLGDVMKESAQAALTYIHSIADKLSIKEENFNNYDIHIHIPAGAIPKDGPSAGITIATALVSLLMEQPVSDYLAMTGEITLTGAVLPVGGIKEKVLAAARANIKEIILPDRNENDLDTITEEIKGKLKFHFVNKMDEVIKIALKNKKNKQQ